MEVKNYFSNKVVPYLNPYTEDDTLEKIMNIIIQDVQIGPKKKACFKARYDAKDVAGFLSDTFFLYSLQRKNKKATDTVEHQDVPFLQK